MFPRFIIETFDIQFSNYIYNFNTEFLNSIISILESSPFIDVLFLQEFYKQNDYVYYTSVSLNNFSLEIYYFTTHTKSSDILHKSISIWKWFDSLLLKNNHNTQKQIYTCILLDIDIPKQINNEKCCKPLHVNGGVTYFLINKVIIFRTEDMLYTLIHEIIHALDLDFKSIQIPFPKYNNQIIYRSISSNSYLANESITDVITTIIHSHFISCINNLDFNSIIKSEIDNMTDLVKILNNYFNKNNIQLVIEEESNCVAYYIMKQHIMLLLFTYDDICLFLAVFSLCLNLNTINLSHVQRIISSRLNSDIKNKNLEEYFSKWLHSTSKNKLNRTIFNI